MARRESLTPRRLLQLFEEGSSQYSRPLLTRNPDQIFTPPPLLPGETLILQQDNVSCIGTLNSVANGVLHLTNYRIIFNGSYIQDISSDNPGNIDPEDLARQGYRYQKRKYQFPMHKVNPQLKKFQSLIERSVRKGGRTIGNSFKRSKRLVLFNKYSLEEEEPEVQTQDEDENCMVIGVRPLLERATSERTGRLNQDQVCISIPNLSISAIQKFPKQYLEKEKLMMLRDGIEILCTNLLTFRFGLGGTETYDADELITRLTRHTFVKTIGSSFAVTFSQSLMIPHTCNILEDRTAPNFYRFLDESRRLGIVPGKNCQVKRQRICDTYPESVVFPQTVGDAPDVRQLAEFHWNDCFPVIVWRHSSGNILLRSSSPIWQRGSTEFRCEEDERFIDSLCQSAVSPSDIKLKIFTQGQKQTPGTSISTSGGLTVEEGQRYYYPHCSVIYVEDMPEYQSVQESGVKLMTMLHQKLDDSRFLACVEETGWLLQIQRLLETSSSVAVAMEADKISVLLAFNTGTDQTAQVSSLAQLLLDPYYRTLDGFQILLQKEWLNYRHNFIGRNIWSVSKEEDLAPVFLQFLDCVWQLMQQFPTYFQFNEYFLECLAKHAYSGRFGSFFGKKATNDTPLISFWTWVNVVSMAQDDFTNPIYDEDEGQRPIFPETGMEWLQLWTWHWRYQKEENLVQAFEIKMMQTEKLQREYKDIMAKYQNLLKQMSDRDAEYASTFHSRSTGDICDGPVTGIGLHYRKDSNASSASSTGRSEDHGTLKGLGSIFGKKAKSFSDLLGLHDDSFSKCGHSKFYDVQTPTQTRSMGRKGGTSTLPSSLQISEKFSSLKDYLETRGVQTKGVCDVQISAKTCCGFLIKQGKLHKNWKKRWFVLDLQKRYIAYFDNPAKEPKRVFSYLNIRDVKPHPDQRKNPNLFLLHTFERTFYIQAPGHQAMDIWVACLSVPLTVLLP